MPQERPQRLTAARSITSTWSTSGTEGRHLLANRTQSAVRPCCHPRVNRHNEVEREPGVPVAKADTQSTLYGALYLSRGVAQMTEATFAGPEEQDFSLASLSPSLAQKRLALVVLFLVVAFLIIAGPLSSFQLPQVPAFIPIYATAMF